MNVQGKVFVVTGAGNGIGAALTKTLLDKGAHVAAVDIAFKNTKPNNKLSLHELDVTDRKAVLALPKAVIKAHGKVDALINNAGIIQPFVRVNNLEFKDIERVMDVNFYGTVNMVKAFLPELLRRPEGYIANVSSMGGFLPVPGQSVYGASKAAVKLLTEGLYAELKDTNVHVSTIFPGATDTKISENSGVSVPGISEEDRDKFPSLSVDRAAAVMVAGIEKNKPLILTGKDSKLMNKLYRLSPVFAVNLITKQMKALLG